MNKRFAGGVAIAIAALLLTGCAATQYGHAEYGTYDSVDALAADSTDVVQVTVIGSHDETLVSAPFEGTDPETNPYYGVDDAELPSDDQVSIDVTVFDVTVVEAFKGDEKKGVTLGVSQLKNDEATVPLKEGETYVLFLRNVDPSYPAGLVGGPQGQFLLVDGKLVAANSETSFEVTVDQLRNLKQ